MEGKNEWYDNKQIFEMMQQTTNELVEFKNYITKEFTDLKEGFTEDINELRVEMKETKMLIRDYNGLRKDVADVKMITLTHIAEEKREDDIAKRNLELNNSNRKEHWSIKNWHIAVVGTIIGALGLLVGLLW